MGLRTLCLYSRIRGAAPHPTVIDFQKEDTTTMVEGVGTPAIFQIRLQTAYNLFKVTEVNQKPHQTVYQTTEGVAILEGLWKR